MSEVPAQTFSTERLREFSERVFVAMGVPPDDSKLAAEVLALSDLRGIDSHGIARLSSYVRLLREGKINPRPNITVVRESPSTATVDGGNGLGLVVGPRANEIAMDKADAVGTGWVAVCNTNHFGIAGYYVIEALARDQIGWCMTNTSRITAPLWGAERMLGSNPLAIAFPGLKEPPIVIDMATTAVPYGRIEMAYRRGERLASGWAIDGDGVVAKHPEQVMTHGALLPLGSDRERGGHKGYCLSALVDILCGPLSGANWGPFTPSFVVGHAEPTRSVGKGIGHFFGAMKIDAFIEPLEFKRQIDEWICTFRGTKPAPGTSGPLIPGDPEREAEQRRISSGVPLVMPVVEDLRQVSRDLGVPFE